MYIIAAALDFLNKQSLEIYAQNNSFFPHVHHSLQIPGFLLQNRKLPDLPIRELSVREGGEEHHEKTWIGSNFMQRLIADFVLSFVVLILTRKPAKRNKLSWIIHAQYYFLPYFP